MPTVPDENAAKLRKIIPFENEAVFEKVNKRLKRKGMLYSAIVSYFLIDVEVIFV